jgi:nicotinamide-nucleotide amidase
MVPESAEIISNPAGTAPGLVLRKNGVIYIFMPGVPQELQLMMEGPVPVQLKSNLDIPAIRTHLLRTTGITEAGLYEKIRDIVDAESRFQLSFLPRGIGVDLRFKHSGNDQNEHVGFNRFIASVRKRIGKYVFTEEDISMQEHIGNLLRERNLTLGVAESFTGGVICDWLTNVPGSSAYFLGGVITYSNRSKADILNVKTQTLEQYGAVSEETVKEMVRGAQNRFRTDCSIATTGIAGPSGGTDKKPVGLCYVAARYGSKEGVRQFNFGKNRLRTKNRGAIAAMELLRRLILEIK